MASSHTVSVCDGAVQALKPKRLPVAAGPLKRAKAALTCLTLPSTACQELEGLVLRVLAGC